MANYKHMNLDDRIEIQKGLKEGKSFAEIGAIIGRDGSTISKEIRSHLVVKETGTRSRPYNPCIHRKNCQTAVSAKTAIRDAENSRRKPADYS